jgi:hypothetical protein
MVRLDVEKGRSERNKADDILQSRRENNRRQVVVGPNVINSAEMTKKREDKREE